MASPIGAKLFAELSAEKYDPLSREEERKLILRAKKGDGVARKVLAERNLRFVAKMASKYAQPQSEAWVELIQAGTVGLMEALEKFDPERGTRFLTFAAKYVWSQMYRLLVSKLSLLRLSSSDKRLIVTMYRLVPELERDLGRTPTLDEIVEALAKKGIRADKGKVELILNKNHLVLSLDEIEEKEREERD